MSSLTGSCPASSGRTATPIGGLMKRLRLAYADRVGAGASAEARYRELSRSWWARVRMTALLSILTITVLTLVSALVWPAHRELFAGFGVGIAATMYTAFLVLAVPAHIDHWREGAEAEKRTAKQLKPLLRKAGWTAVHDRAGRYSNRDHIVIGPSGVYLLDTKAPGGIVTVEDGVMTVRRREDPDDRYEQASLARRMKGAAAELADDLHRATSHKAWVTPVVVIWAPFEQHTLKDSGVLWIHCKALRDWLAGQEVKLAHERREQLARAIEALPRAASAPEPSQSRRGKRRSADLASTSPITTSVSTPP
jgi:Nuclease-related domain